MKQISKKPENHLEFLSLIQFAIENIYQIKNVNEVTSNFQTAIENITNERHDHFSQISPLANTVFAHQFIGQEDYIFQFREDSNSFGEFNLDFLPADANEYLNNQFQAMAGKKEILPENSKRLANFRIQLFIDGLLSHLKLKKKYKVVYNYIVKQYGLENLTQQAKDSAKLLKQETGMPIDCWYFEKNGTGYIITLYLFGGKSGTRSYVSFSVSEVFKPTTI